MIKIKNLTARNRPDQSGAAAIFVVMILTTLLALISIGFSHLMNREVRQSLDRQLTAGAYYAAESGVNDARTYLASGGAASFNGCATPQGDRNFVVGTDSRGKPVPGDITGDGLVRYSCTTINVSPNELVFNLQPGQSKIFQLTPASLSAIYFSWQRDSPVPSTPLGPIGSLPKENSAAPTAAGILRVALYPASGPSADTNAALAAASRNYFLYPDGGNGYNGNKLTCSSSSSRGCVNYANAAQNGSFISGNCNSGTYPGLPFGNAARRFCNSGIGNIGSAGSTYYVRITAMYTPIIGAMEIADSTGNSLAVPGNQGYIDITGTTADVSQRVRAIISTVAEFDNPANALWSMQSICKLFRVPVNSQGQYDSPTTDNAADPNGGDGLCAASTPNNSGGNIP